jgi:hypothetical protein
MPLVIRKTIYILEAILILFPTIIFLVSSLGWLFVGLEFKSWGPTFYAFLVWIGGLFGVTLLIQLLLCLLSESAMKIRFFGIRMLAGIASSVTPFVFLYSTSLNSEDHTAFLLFLCPVFVGVHWLWDLKTHTLWIR